jgi:hypothetical protein
MHDTLSPDWEKGIKTLRTIHHFIGHRADRGRFLGLGAAFSQPFHGLPRVVGGTR